MSEAIPVPFDDQQPANIHLSAVGNSDAEIQSKPFNASDVPVSHLEIRPLMDRKLFSADERIANIAALAFKYYAEAIGADINNFPDTASIRTDYLPTARTLYKSREPAHQAALATMKLDFKEFRRQVRISPVPIAEKIAALESVHEEPEVAALAVKLWLYESLESSSTISKELEKSRSKTKRTKFLQGFPQLHPPM